ncbi:hypothetical protein LIER_19786 [Lithospermum erythrorhizon]|uniref:Uncharacterized protein n=1 Tax=Lithospermum erythrorhizon TaxID=34254 RepID=A0AAV3QJ23_LITER
MKIGPSELRAMIGLVAGGGRTEKPLRKQHPHGGGNHQYIGYASPVRPECLMHHPPRRLVLLPLGGIARRRGILAALAAMTDKAVSNFICQDYQYTFDNF